MKIKIPNYYRVGGQFIRIEFPEKIVDSKLGTCCVSEGVIRIAQTFNGTVQSESSKLNTFFHELTHSILDTMGRYDLSSDEQFVNTFASFLTEAYVSSQKYDDEYQYKTESGDDSQCPVPAAGRQG